MNIVLDCSAALSWCFEDEMTVASRRLLTTVMDGEVVVPSLWHLEIINILQMAERKNRITQAQTTEFLTLLGKLNIAVDEQTSLRAFNGTIDLCRLTSLTAYDAAYLELALRRGLKLASKDKMLLKISKALGVKVLDIN